jgi:hypothetical protein
MVCHHRVECNFIDENFRPSRFCMTVFFVDRLGCFQEKEKAIPHVD